MAEDIVVIETVAGVVEAELMRSLLESAGINVELSHEAALSAFSLGVGRLARVDLLVRKEQEAAARSLIDDYRAGRLEASEGDTPGDAPPAA